MLHLTSGTLLRRCLTQASHGVRHPPFHRAVPTAYTSGYMHVRREYHSPTAENPSPADDEAYVSALDKIADVLYASETGSLGIDPSRGKRTELLTSPEVSSSTVSDSALVDDATVQEMMDLLINLDDPVTSAAWTDTGVTTTNRSIASSPSALAALQSSAEQGAAAALLSLLTTTEEKRSPTCAAASELLTTGLDAKAVLGGRPLVNAHLSRKSLRQCDLSLTQFESVTCESCDFRRSLFYKSHFSHVVFRHCRFDGAVLRQASCTKRVLFEDCSFCFAHVGLRGTNPSRKHVSRNASGGAGVRFVRCDFDLADFDGSDGLNDPLVFQNCRNTQTARHFPLRVRTET